MNQRILTLQSSNSMWREEMTHSRPRSTPGKSLWGILAVTTSSNCSLLGIRMVRTTYYFLGQTETFTTFGKNIQNRPTSQQWFNGWHNSVSASWKGYTESIGVIPVTARSLASTVTLSRKTYCGSRIAAPATEDSSFAILASPSSTTGNQGPMQHQLG